MKPKDYNLDWSKYFSVDWSSPSGLVWNAPQYFRGTPNYSRVGQPVGSIGKTKTREYWSVGLSEDWVRSTYLLHRIVWVMVHGYVDPENDIDHIDGNGLNNKIENLRECSKSINNRNAKKRIDNKSGTSGISYQTTRTSEGWKAVIVGLEGEKYSKYYSVLKYGDSAKDLAIEWRKLKMIELDNAGYTENHGV